MKNVAILTDFVGHDPAYSLCAVVANQVKMLRRGGIEPMVAVRKGFSGEHPYGDELVVLDPGETGSNTVNITAISGDEIARLTAQMQGILEVADVVLTHDLIYQANLWKYHVAARRVAKLRPGLRWLHWIHSSTDMGVARQIGSFTQEISGSFPNAKLVAHHYEEFERKRGLYGYEPHQVVVIPHPIDFAEDFHPAATEAVEKNSLWDADVIAVYPCRLDRGKQPHIVVEIFAELATVGWDARVVVVDFHSTGGDKKTYRDEMKALAAERGVRVAFTSDLEYPGASYHIPHKAVMDLFEFGDVLIHPSRSESDPLSVPEAAWKRCGLLLNFDLPLFRLYQGRALLFQFSSNVDALTGKAGATETEYGDRRTYMAAAAGAIAYVMNNNPILQMHAEVRKTRSLKAVWERHLWPAIESS